MFPVNLPFTSGISQPAMLFPINPYEIPSLVPRIPDDLPRKKETINSQFVTMVKWG